MASVTRSISNSPSTDPVLETQVFWVQYRTRIVAGVIVALLALAAYGGYRFYMARRDASAAAMLSEANSGADFQRVMATYPSAPAAATACLLLADKQRSEQKFAEANETLRSFIAKYPKHELITSAQIAMAGNLESLGKPEEALALYRRIPAEHPRSFNAPIALVSEIHLLRQKGQIEEARRVCETVLTQYRDSYSAQEATRYLRLLKPANTTPQPTPVPAPSATP